MIAKNEDQIISEMQESMATYARSWVTADTGSDDGTQDVIRNRMARLGNPGELHKRRCRNVGPNRTEAPALAKGDGEYIFR
jgi:hypothetical protein